LRKNEGPEKGLFHFLLTNPPEVEFSIVYAPIEKCHGR